MKAMDEVKSCLNCKSREACDAPKCVRAHGGMPAEHVCTLWKPEKKKKAAKAAQKPEDWVE